MYVGVAVSTRMSSCVDVMFGDAYMTREITADGSMNVSKVEVEDVF